MKEIKIEGYITRNELREIYSFAEKIKKLGNDFHIIEETGNMDTGLIAVNYVFKSKFR
jgi:hypothetical protein